MANHHFAKLGDVWKHLPLIEALRSEPPAAYCETHAGSAWYPLTPSPERRYGIYTFMERAPRHPALAASAYRSLLLGLPDRNGALLRYPGSAAQAMLELGDRAQYMLADTDEASVADLCHAASELGLERRARCVLADGVLTVFDYCIGTGLRPSTVIVHVDPFDPHDRSGPAGFSPLELAWRLAERSFRVAYWYGLGQEEARGWAWQELRHAAPAWCGELVFPARFVYSEHAGLWGCGMVFLNFAPSTYAAMAALGYALASVYGPLPSEGEPPVEFTEYR